MPRMWLQYVGHFKVNDTISIATHLPKGYLFHMVFFISTCVANCRQFCWMPLCPWKFRNNFYHNITYKDVWKALCINIVLTFKTSCYGSISSSSAHNKIFLTEIVYVIRLHFACHRLQVQKTKITFFVTFLLSPI